MTSDLARELADHLADSFPDSVVKGDDYAEVEPVMIDADIYGWASSIAAGTQLAPPDRQRLTQARDELERSISTFPPDARAFYERLVRIANLALSQS